jgi:uncharacterized membrane protein
MKVFWQNIVESLKGKNPGSVGAVTGLILALSLILFGFLNTLFLIGMSILGYFLGVRYFRNREAFRDLLDKILPPGMFR